MPELPEVESISRELNHSLAPSARVSSVQVNNSNLRFPVPKNLESFLAGKTILSVARRAKYLIFTLNEGRFISHLGMTGSWRFEKSEFEQRLHDHLIVRLADRRVLIFNDPRRFGYVDVLGTHELDSSRWFHHLGIEPLSDNFTVQNLKAKTASLKCSIRTALMNQKIVVGIGNIYVSEILFLSGIRPQRKVSKVTSEEWGRVIKFTRLVLNTAIKNRGTTFSDYRRTDGAKGENQNFLKVYGRDKVPCAQCGGRISKVTVGGRSSFFCRHCQK